MLQKAKAISKNMRELYVAAVGESRQSCIMKENGAGILGSNSTQGMDVCHRLFCVCVVLCNNLATG
jgi:hypothetical protein